MAWQQIFSIANNEIRLIVREKTFLMLLFVFFLMTFFSAYIGWSTNTIVLKVYQASVDFLKLSGITHLPPDPFINIPPLSIFKNMIIYVFLIGALMAIVLGHRSFIRERKTGVVQLLFSKQVSRNNYIVGKILGISSLLFILVGITFILSLISSFFIPHVHLSIIEIEKLSIFYLISLVYLTTFALIAFIFGVILPDESLALFAPILFWVVVTFILPELTTGQNPVALLNPTNISQNTIQGTFFTTMHKLLFPVSIEQHFVGIAQPLLETQPSFQKLDVIQALSSNSIFIVLIIFYLLIAIILSYFALRNYSVSKDKMYA